MTLQRILTLAAANDWMAIRNDASSMLAVVTDASDRAKAHAFVSIAYVKTARSADDWKVALRHAHISYELAPVGTTLFKYALYRLSGLYVDMGRPMLAKRFATMYLRHASNDSALAPYTPFVVRDLAHIAYQGRRFDEAARLFSKALAMFGEGEQGSRTATNLVWALLRSGRVAEARQALPDVVPASIEYLRLGALAALLAAEGRLDEATNVGRLALSDQNRLSFDNVDGAEVALILSDVARRLGEDEDFAFVVKDFCARQDWNVNAVHVLTIHGREGRCKLLYVHAASSVGSGGYHPDACYTTSVA